MDCEGLCDEDVRLKIPSDWWLTNAKTKSFLAKKVHRNNKEISPQVSHLPRGSSRKEQRCIASAHVDEERVNASVVREAADESVQAHRRLQLLVGKLAASKTISDNIALQLRLLNEHKDHYVSKHGEESWVEKVNDLLSKLPDPSGE